MIMKNNFQVSIHNSQIHAGYIALVSMLIISAVALAIAVSISVLSVDEAKNSLSYKKGQETLGIAKGCTESALIRLRDNSGYTGETLVTGDGTCTILVTESASVISIDVLAQITGPPLYEKNIIIEATRSGNSVNVTSVNQVQ